MANETKQAERPKKAAIAKGWCKDCRWAMDLPQGKYGPFEYHCAALPPTYEPVEVEPSGLSVVGAGKQNRIELVLMPLAKKPMDFCRFFEPMPGSATPADSALKPGAPASTTTAIGAI